MRDYRLLFRSAFLIYSILACLAIGQAQTAQSPLPTPTGFVNDYAQVVDSATASRMETILTNLKQRADIEFAVVTVKTTGETPIYDYSLAVARGWGIGSGSGDRNSALLLVAVDDRKYQIHISRHLEGDLPDGVTGEIGRRMREPFRRGDYSSGLMTAVQTFVSTLAEKRNFNIEGIDKRYVYREAEQPAGRSNRGSGLSSGACLCIALVIIIIFMASRGGGGRRGGGMGGGGLMNMLLLSTLLNSGGRSSGWSGGGFGGSGGGGGGGGGFGGFGGGGDFGGGGSGGDW